MIWIRDLIDEITPTFSKAMKSLQVDDSVWLPLIGRATVADHGDIALPCHSLASRLRKSPQDIAEQICSLVKEDLAPIANVSSISGFVNVSAKPAWLSRSRSLLLSDPRLGIESANRPM